MGVEASSRTTGDSNAIGLIMPSGTYKRILSLSQQETKVAVKPEVTHNLVKNNEWTNETQETDNPEIGEVTFKTVKRRKRG